MKLLKNVTRDLEKRFKFIFICLFVLYLSLWVATIFLSVYQKKNNIQPLLPVLAKDSSEYATLIENMQNSGRFALGSAPETYRVPGYIFFASIVKTATGGSYFGVTLVQILLVFASALLVGKIGESFFSRGTGQLALILFLLNPVVIVSSLIIMTDILFLFLFISGFYLISIYSGVKFKFAVITGAILFSASMYIRAMGLFALPIFIIPALISPVCLKKKLVSVTVIIIVALGMLVPWMSRNYYATGSSTFTSFKAYNLTYYTVPMFLAWKNHTSEEIERSAVERDLNISASKWRDIRLSSKLNNYSSKILLANPLQYLRYHAIVSLPFFFSSSVDYAKVAYRSSMHIPGDSSQGAIRLLVSGQFADFFKAIVFDGWKFVERILWMIIFALAAFTVYMCRKKPVVWAFVFIIVYFALLAGPAANARYAIQAEPFIFLLSSAAICRYFTRIKTESSDMI